MCAASRGAAAFGGTLSGMVNVVKADEGIAQLESLLERWQTSLDLHAKYASLDEERYQHVQPWPKHERPQRWIIQLARKRILALKRIVAQRQAEGDRAFIEGIEIMSFLATLVGPTSVERFIPLATLEGERRDVLTAKPDIAPKTSAVSRTAESRRVNDPGAKTGEHKRTADTTRQMPVMPNSKVYRMLAAQRAGVPIKPATAVAAKNRDPRRDPNRPATIKPKKSPSNITPQEHTVIADAVRLLGWGRQWHELADMIARLSERPAPSEIRRILRTYRNHIDAITARRSD
jgi:hypothetical protein